MIKDLNKQNQALENATAQEILRWAWDTFSPKIVATSSFQTQSLPLLHLISITIPAVPVIFIDTGFHFPETLAFRDRLTETLKLNLRIIKSELSNKDFLEKYGPLYQQRPDVCCYINKIEPTQVALEGNSAWISGIRRDQTIFRDETPFVGHHPFLPLFKINPMVKWSVEDINQYIEQHKLPAHPLNDQGYKSIGCMPCTTPVAEGEDERAGRWRGIEKLECGLHFP